jgi:hypothetical protein
VAEYDMNIDTNGDGAPDYVVLAIDNGIWTGTGTPDGQYVSVVYNIKTQAWIIRFLADAPTDGSTILVPFLASDIGVTPASPRFTYTTSVYNLVDGTSADLPGKASFNAFAPSITNGGDAFTTVDRNKLAFVPVSVNAAEWAKTPALGLMIVSEDNKSGDTQGFLIPVK